MALDLSVYTIGGGDQLQDVFNAVATVFNNTAGIGAITSLAITMGGLFAIFEFSKSRDVTKLIKWAGMYVLVTSLMLYPKATVHIEDQSGIDLKPRAIDNVPLSLAIFAKFTSQIGIGFAQVIETVFHLPDDMPYNKTGMLMGSKLIVASRNFQITDPAFSQTLNEFMQQCVFFDLLLNKYTIQDLMHAQNPWAFIQANTSVARAFPFDGTITPCNEGAIKLGEKWKTELKNAAAIYGSQIIGDKKQAATTLFSHLGSGYAFMTGASKDGEELLKTNMLANAMSQALSHYGANTNAPAALQAYMDTKTELQMKQSLTQTGMQAGMWLQYYVNILQAVIYSLFVIVYFFSYSPFGVVIIRNYLTGMFVLQSFAPMYAVINFVATSYAQGRSALFMASDSTHSHLSIANVMGVAQANADAMAIAGYLMWPVTIGGAIMLWRGMPGAIQSMGQYIGGIAQHSASHLAAEAIGGNISTGNTNFDNHSQSNTNANHFDTNARFAAGMSTWQTGTGSTISITPSGTEVMDSRGSVSNLGVSVQLANSMRSALSKQTQMGYNAVLNESQAAGEQYSAALRQLNDYGSSQSRSISSGKSSTTTESTGFSQSAHDVSQLIETFRKEHHVTHDRAAEVLGRVYADTKVGVGFIASAEAGASVSASESARSSFGSLYNDAKQFAVDHNFSETVDSARRAAVESHYRDGTDQGSRYADSISSSFDRGDSFRNEAVSSYSKASSYSSLASQSQDDSSSVLGNYTQGFYEWMRTQPTPHGHGTISKSAIDNMAAHDPGLLQSYANRYVEERTSSEVNAFSHAHHLNHGASHVKQDYQHYSHAVAGKAHVSEQYSEFKKEVNAEKQSHPGSLGSIDHSIEAQTQQQMATDKQKLEDINRNVTKDSASLKENVTDKVKGQVLGSIDGTKGSLLETMKGKDRTNALHLPGGVNDHQ